MPYTEPLGAYFAVHSHSSTHVGSGQAITGFLVRSRSEDTAGSVGIAGADTTFECLRADLTSAGVAAGDQIDIDLGPPEGVVRFTVRSDPSDEDVEGIAYLQVSR